MSRADHLAGLYDRVPFSPAPDRPVDRWMQLPMGWDVALAMELIREFAPARTSLVIDPFVGCGAGLLAARDLGMVACGVDRASAAVVASRAKCGPHVSVEAVRRAQETVGDGARPVRSATKGLPLQLRALVATVLTAHRLDPSRSLAVRFGEVIADLGGIDTDGPPAHVWQGDALAPSTWAAVARVGGRGRWLIAGSPPHPGSRGSGLTTLGPAQRAWNRDLAREITGSATVRDFRRPESTWFPGFLSRIEHVAPSGSVVVQEYERVAEPSGRVRTTLGELTPHWARRTTFVRLYDTAPDGKGDVIEGGVAVIHL